MKTTTEQDRDGWVSDVCESVANLVRDELISESRGAEILHVSHSAMRELLRHRVPDHVVLAWAEEHAPASTQQYLIDQLCRLVRERDAEIVRLKKIAKDLAEPSPLAEAVAGVCESEGKE
jgi:hypothetical protein